VLYSHRSNVLHTLMSIQPDMFGLGARDVVLPIVPMFHANAWGIAFSAPAVGAKLVLPGARLDGASLHELLEREGVTVSAGVPTVWQAVLQHLVTTGSRLTSLERIIVGGAACPPSLIRRFADEFGIDVVHAWGMTELSPLGGLSAPVPAGAALDADGRFALRSKQGRVPFGIEMALRDDAGAPLPHDGRTFGHIRMRGFAVLEHYYRAEGVPVLDAEGYFDTGDIGTIDPYGYLQITDRAKDLIKSGGEWISSIEIESAACAHAKVYLAAVIGVPHAKWGERPLLLVQLRPGERADAEDILGALRGRIATWWMPDEVRFVAGLPLGATGKIDKKALRAQFGQG
jgi:fatty-acyl-CoA synthase